jgi:hypothetical protein
MTTKGYVALDEITIFLGNKVLLDTVEAMKMFCVLNPRPSIFSISLRDS